MKKIITLSLCFILIMSFTACNNSGGDKDAIAPPMANTILSGGGNAQLGADADGNTVIENFADGNYAEWTIEITEERAYSAEVEYASQNDEFASKVELYSEEGKLQAEADLTLKGTGGDETFDSASVELGDLTAGLYTLILRPNNKEKQSINIKSIKLV